MTGIKVKGQGFTLVEMMVSLAVFSVTLVVLMTVCSQGVKSWQDVNAKQEAEHGLSRSLADISDSVKNSYFDGIKCSPVTVDDKGGGFLIVPSAAYWRPASSNSKSSVFDEKMAGSSFFPMEFDTDSESGDIKRNFMIVYFTAYSKGGCDECAALFSNAMFEYCPHKHLVKRWYDAKMYSDEDKADATNLMPWAGAADKFKTDSSFISDKYVSESNYDKILANNVFAFKASKTSEGAVAFSLKSFKPSGNRVQMTPDAFEKSLQLFHYFNEYKKPEPTVTSSGATVRQFYKASDFIEDPASFGASCMMQMDAVVFPMNDK